MRFVLFTVLALLCAILANLALRWRIARLLLSLTPFVAALGLLLLAYSALSTSHVILFIFGGLALAALGFKPVRIYLAHFLPIDPNNSLHASGLALTLFFVFDHFGQYLFNGPAPQISSAPVSFYDQLTNFILMLGLAFFGVGFLTRRTPATTFRRLGLRRINRFQIFFAFGLGGAFQLVGLIAYFLSHALTPSLAQSVDQSSGALLNDILAQSVFGLPVGIVFLAISAGLGEEMLFRGALQPRLGLILTALLFSAFHDQYGFSFELLSIFALALVLGWLRNTMNLWACIIVHTWFDFLASFSFSIPLVIAIALIGVVLCLILLYSHAHRLFPEESSPIRWHQI